MGCGIGKRRVDAQVDLILEESGDPRFDAIFNRLEVPLLRLSKARKKLKRALRDFTKEVGTHKQLSSPTFFDSLMAMLFCFSASGEGNLENVNFAFRPEVPFITVNPDLLYMEHRRIVSAWVKVVTLAHKIPRKLADLQTKLDSAIREVSNVPNESEGGATAAELMNSSHMQKAISSNFKKLMQAPNILREVLFQCREVSETVSNLPQILSDGSAAIVAVGQQAYVDQVLLPREIIENYWPSSPSQRDR